MLDELDLLALTAPAGNGQANNPADISALDNALRRIEAYTPPPEYAGEAQRYATEPMIRALERYQEQNGLKVDGYAKPNGPTERAINNRLLEKPKGAGLLFDPPAPLAGTVGNGFENRRGDVATVQRILGALDHLPEDPFDRPHGFIDENTTGAIQSFQRKRGLDPDGWLAPGGETERALHEAAANLARAKGREWLRFAERAGRAQTVLSSAHRRPEFPSNIQFDALDQRLDSGLDTAPEGEVIPAQSRSVFGALPGPVVPGTGIDPDREATAPGSPADAVRRFVDALGRYARSPVRFGPSVRRESLPESDRPGSRVENIPQHVPNEPFRGPDPAKPPLSSTEAQPAPYPSEPPDKVPDREELRPQELKPEDWILIDPIAAPLSPSDFILRMRGNERTQGRLTGLREIGEDVAKERNDVRLIHIGGARDHEGATRKEFYAANPRREELGIKTTAGAAYADLTFEDERTGELYHISVYRVTSGSKPRKEEVEQSIRLAINTAGKTRIIVMVPNVHGDGFVNAEAFKQFLHATLDSLRDAPKVTDMSDPVSRERVIRYFTQLSRK